MKLTPYKQLLGMSQDEKDALLMPAKINTAKKQAELTLARHDEKILKIENNILELSSSADLNLEKIADAYDELGLVERRKKQFQQIIDELFPKE